MTIDAFIRELEQGIEGVQPGSLGPDTVFEDLPQWDSLAVLATLAVVDGAFGVQVSAEDIRRCPTIQELHALAQKKAG